MTTYWAVPMYKFLGYRDTILDKYEPLKVRIMRVMIDLFCNIHT